MNNCKVMSFTIIIMILIIIIVPIIINSVLIGLEPSKPQIQIFNQAIAINLRKKIRYVFLGCCQA